ncbi:unnamed protein product [Sphagnum compactum]
MLGEAGDICGIFGETERAVVKNGNCQRQEAVYIESTHLQLNHKTNEYEEKVYQFIVSSVVIIADWELFAEKQQIAEELQANALPQLQQRRQVEMEKESGDDHAREAALKRIAIPDGDLTKSSMFRIEELEKEKMLLSSSFLEQWDGYKLVQLCLEERVGQLTGEVAVHVKEKQELQTHAMTIKNLWRTMEQVKQLGGKVSSHVESKQGLQKHVSGVGGALAGSSSAGVGTYEGCRLTQLMEAEQQMAEVVNEHEAKENVMALQEKA